MQFLVGLVRPSREVLGPRVGIQGGPQKADRQEREPNMVTNTRSPLVLCSAAVSRVGNGRNVTASRTSKLSRRMTGSIRSS